MLIKKERLKQIVSKFPGKKILVVGDLILDRHVFGEVNRISPEAPVPVVWAKKETFGTGGAANVALNLTNFDAKVTVCGLIGKDNFGKRLQALLNKKKINTKLILKNRQRKTTLKTRIIAHHQQVVRIDWESPNNCSKKTSERIIKDIENEITNFDAVIVEDYGKGLITPFLVKELVRLCREHEKIITVDPKEDHFRYYQGVTSLTPNLSEAQVASGIKAKNASDIKRIGLEILKNLQPKSVLITLGEKGMMLFEKTRIQHIPTAALEVYDVTGAGDTVISMFTLALLAKATYFEAAQVANLAAGVVVGKLGASGITKKELLNTLK